MKERWIGVGLGVGAVLALGIVWTDSAQAFSLDTPVTVTNRVGSGETPIFDGPTTVTVAAGGTTLSSFGQLWDITLTPGLISFSLNSPFFANVTTGVDVYRFEAADYGSAGSFSLFGAKVTTFGDFIEGQLPYAVVQDGKQLEVLFPLGFAAGDFREMKGELRLEIDLDIRPTPVPTPALLPGLVGVGLATLRKRHADNQVE